MSAAAPLLAADPAALHIVHQTGERDVDLVRTAYERAGLQAEVVAFLYDMGQRLRSADLVVCRAGAMTLADLAKALEVQARSGSLDGAGALVERLATECERAVRALQEAERESRA